MSEEDFEEFEDEVGEFGEELEKYEDKNKEDVFQDQMEEAEYLYNKLRKYIESNGIQMLNKNSDKCILNLMELLEIR